MASRGITLKGNAAQAFVEMAMGKAPKTEDDEFLRIATLIHMEMKIGKTERAVAILKRFANGQKAKKAPDADSLPPG